MIKIQLDHRAIREILRSDSFQKAVDDVATDVAEHVSGQIEGRTWDVVEVQSRKTDRAVASVQIPGYNAGLYQVRDGVLTKAALASGLTFKQRRA